LLPLRSLAPFVLACCILPLRAQSQLSDHQSTSLVCTQQNSSLGFNQNLSVFMTATFANNGFYAKSFDRHLSLVGLQYGLLLTRNHIVALSYIPEITPVAFLAQPSIHGFAVRRSIPSVTRTQYVYGLGSNPASFELAFRPLHKVQPLLDMQGGFLYFSSKVPSVAAARFNFVADGRIGAKIVLGSGRSMSVAYVFHHLSNGFEAKDNPGVDSQMIYAGYTFNLR
jgi:hypothetical protein